MQLPQYNIENSFTNQLAKQLNKAKAVSVYLLDQCSSAINNSSSSAFRRREFPRRDNFRDSNERRIREGYRKILHRLM